VDSLLLKNEEHRPSTSEIFSYPLLQKSMKNFVKIFSSNVGESVGLTPKQKVLKKKEEEVKKRFEEISLAALEAFKDINA